MNIIQSKWILLGNIYYQTQQHWDSVTKSMNMLQPKAKYTTHNFYTALRSVSQTLTLRKKKLFFFLLESLLCIF